MARIPISRRFPDDRRSSLTRAEFDHNTPFATLEAAFAYRPGARVAQWPPGLHQVYSNANAGLLGLVIERSGMQRIRVDDEGVYRFDYYQAFGDFLVGDALNQQAQDLQFPFGQVGAGADNGVGYGGCLERHLHEIPGMEEADELATTVSA